MANLLEKSSIVLTPTAYDDGKVLCVIPKAPPYGDFDFSRNSSATRINAQGLVEDVQILSSDLVQNGNFSEIGTEDVLNGDFSEEGAEEVSNGSFSQEGVELLTQPVNLVTDFSINTFGTVIVDADTFTTSGGTFDGIRKLSFLTVGKKYRLVIEGDTTSSGFTLGSNAASGNEYGIGFGTHYFTAVINSNLWVRQQTAGTTNITNFSIVEVGQDWTLGTGWSIGEDKAICDGTQASSTLIVQDPVTNTNTNIKVSFTISGYVSGIFRVRNSGGYSGTFVSGNGTYVFYGNTGTGTNIVLDADADFNGSITNISVKEVGQNWVLSPTFTIAENKLRCISDGSYQYANQSCMVVGKTYKMTFDITDWVSGSVRVRPSGELPFQSAGSNGSYVFYYTNVSNSTLAIERSGTPTDLSITNISVKEVGQNWTFGDGFTPDEVNSKATCDGTQTAATNLQQTISTNIQNQLVRVSFTLDYTAGLLLGSLSGTGGIDFNNITSSGTYTAEMTSNEVSPILTLQGDASFIGSITNVIIKSVTNDTNLPRINYEGFSYQDALGSELVTNGDFATDTDWTKGTGWTISGGKANKTSGVVSYVQQNLVISANKTYKVTFELSNYTSGNVKYGFTMPSTSHFGTPQTSNGTYTEYFTPNENTFGLRFRASDDFVGSIDNVSVKEYSGQEVVPNSGCGSWLFEPQSTNLIPYSEDFISGNWFEYSETSATIDASQSNPSGANGSYKIESLSGLGRFGLSSFSVTPSTNYTLSFYVKNINATLLKVLLTDGASPSSYTYTSEANTSGWSRIVINFTSGAVTSMQIQLLRDLPIGQSAYIWGAMIEAQSYVTSYIPTEGTQKTRNQDLCTNGGDVSLINSTEGTLYAEIAALANDGTTRIISLSDGTTANRVNLFFDTTNTLRAFITGVPSIPTAAVITDNNKVALKFKSGDISVWLNGTEVATSTSTISLSGLSNLSFNQVGGSLFFGKTKCLAVWKEALSDQELADLTYPTPTDPTFTLDFDTIAEQFTFARGSEATYVDAQGLIQSTNELGEELITNGDFATNSDWLLGSGSTISGGSLNIILAPYNATTRQVLSLTNGVTYEIVINAIAVGSATDNTFQLGFGNAAGDPSNTTQHEFEEGASVKTLIVTASATDASIIFRSRDAGTSNLSIDNVSVKEYITATNTPRLDYSTGAEAFLLEPQSTNLITQSENLSDASWFKQNGGTASAPSVTANYGISPNGTQNASRVIFDLNGGTTSADYSQIVTVISSIVGNDYTSSVYMKSNNSNTYNVTITDVNGSTNIVSVTPQWQRFDESVVSAAISREMKIRTRGSEGSSDVTDVLIWGAMIEEQSYATSYIPTSGTTVTRNQETCINATPEINSEEGTLYAEIAALSNDGTNRIISISDGTNGNRVQLYYSTGSNSFIGLVYSGGVLSCELNTTLSNATDFIKVALTYKLNDFKLYINGVEVATDTSGNSPIGLDRLDFRLGIGILPFFGNTKDLQVYTKALSDAELIKLTQ